MNDQHDSNLEEINLDDNQIQKASFLYFTFSWDNVKSTISPKTIPGQSKENEITILEGLFLTLFGLFALAFFVAQVIIYVRFCTAKRNSWSIRRKQWSVESMPESSPDYENTRGRLSDSFMVTAVPCKPGLAYSARSLNRSGGVLYLSPYDDIPDYRLWNENSFRMAQSNYASVFMVDPRGHFGPRLSASPEAAMEMYRATGRSLPRLPSRHKKCCCHKKVQAFPPPSTPTECQNPGYESDTLSSPRVSSPEAMSTSPSSLSPGEDSPMLSDSDRCCTCGESSAEYESLGETITLEEKGRNNDKQTIKKSSLSKGKYWFNNFESKENSKGILSSNNLDTNVVHSASGALNTLPGISGRSRIYSTDSENFDFDKNDQKITKEDTRKKRQVRLIVHSKGKRGSYAGAESTSGSDRNSPDSPTRPVLPGQESDSDFSLTSVSSLSVLSTLPTPHKPPRKTRIPTRKSKINNSVGNSWLAKV